MKFLFDLFPVLLFFVAFKLFDIYVATAVAIAATVLQIGWLKWRRRKVDKTMWVTLAIIAVFGGATLVLHDETFIKWKPTVLYWLFGAVIAGAELLFRKNIMRAMACGLPVLASDRPSLRALVEPETSGLLVPAGDVAAWTEALRRASMSPDARRRWGRRGREIAESRFSWTHVARTFESLILHARGTTAFDAPRESDVDARVDAGVGVDLGVGLRTGRV